MLPTALRREEILREVRRAALDLEAALAGDVESARAALAGRLGEVVLEERDGGVYARTTIGPAMLLSGGPDSRMGCGGRIRDLESARREGPVVRVADAPRRRAA